MAAKARHPITSVSCTLGATSFGRGSPLDRYAIFIDAGYLYASGGALVLDTSDRNRIQLDTQTFLNRIRETIDKDFPHSGDFLRVYWYDAAPNAVPQMEHERLAAHSGVKVRLGRLTRNGQKGVDSLVLRDMMRLSGEHAICTAFLLAGDEDLRQGVIEAQDYGVKVVLLGIQPTFGQNQATSLVHEADDARTFTYEELQDCFAAGAGTIGLDDTFDAYQVGFAFGREWAPLAFPAALAEVLSTGMLPRDTHTSLIRRLLEVGDLPPSVQLPGSVLQDARAGFRDALQAAATEAAAEAPPTAQEPPAPVQAAPSPTLTPSVAPPPTEPAVPVAPVPVPMPPTAAVPPAARPPSPPPGQAPEVPADQLWAYTEGKTFGVVWLERQPEEEVRFVRGNFPYLPRDIDVELLRRLQQEMGLDFGAHIEDADRRAARAGFWQALGLELDFGPRRGPANLSFDPIAERDPAAFGRAFARQWIARVGDEDVQRARALANKRVGLPIDADARLLRMASELFGDPVPVAARHRLRDGFLDELQG